DQRILQESGADLFRAGIDLQTHFKIRIRRRSAAEHEFLRALGNLEQLHSLVIESEIKFTIALEAQIFVISVSLQRDGNLVFAVDREIMLDARAAARTNRSRIAQAIVLNERVRNGVSLIGRL